jgi:4-alpha-glucanotransferase
LRSFALHQALSDLHGPFWRDWPAELHDSESPAVRDAAARLGPQIAFHVWLQWRAERELSGANEALKAAGMSTGLYLDLAVGTHPSGAETWEDRESFAYGVSLGAPPDAFSAAGQSWGLAPFNPVSLVARGFAPLAETLRRQLQFCGALRIDHILGFERAFWVPEDGAAGAYVRMPRDAMLAVVRLEAARAGAVIVGEDLGNVPRGLRRALDASGVLGCRLQLFERARDDDTAFKTPASYPSRSMASFSTHDLPTWRGWRAGHEIETHRNLGNLPAAHAEAALAHRALEVAGFDRMASRHAPVGMPDADVTSLHHALAATRSVMALVQVENVLDITPQPNLPGTTTQYPNWRQRLPIAPEALGAHPGMIATAEIMAAQAR